MVSCYLCYPRWCYDSCPFMLVSSEGCVLKCKAAAEHPAFSQTQAKVTFKEFEQSSRAEFAIGFSAASADLRYPAELPKGISATAKSDDPPIQVLVLRVVVST